MIAIYILIKIQLKTEDFRLICTSLVSLQRNRLKSKHHTNSLGIKRPIDKIDGINLGLHHHICIDLGTLYALVSE